MTDSIYLADPKIKLLGWNVCDNLPVIFPITKVHGICFNDIGEILIIQRNTTPGWTLPGGSHKLFETTIDTFIRETMEEATVKLYNPKIIGYRNNSYEDNFANDKDIGYKIMYSAIISEIYEPEKDPSSGIIRERKFIDPRDCGLYFYLDSSGYDLLHNSINYFYNFKKSLSI